MAIKVLTSFSATLPSPNSQTGATFVPADSKSKGGEAGLGEEGRREGVEEQEGGERVEAPADHSASVNI